ncbi:MAG: cytochrome c oxidase assembly protein [Methylosarcina sp.]
MQAKPIKLFTIGELAILPLVAFSVIYYGEISGVLTRHMIIHILLMTLVAPITAFIVRNLAGLAAEFTGIRSLLAATFLQASLFFAWHSPPEFSLIAHGGNGVMHAALFLSALWFWLTVFNQADIHLWRAVLGLLLTGKLFCLLAVLLTFAPRVLYRTDMFHSGMELNLADQQMAGLLMIIACPITYVLAAIVLVYRWFEALCESRSESTASVSASENGS